MYRLGHITDLHARWHQPGTSRIAQRRCRLMPQLLPTALADLAAKGADAVAVTGDLLDVPGYFLSGDDYYDYDRATWEAEIEADYRLLRQILDDAGLPYLVLPGNHDDIAILQRVFAPQLVTDLGGYRLVCFWDRDFYGNVPRRLDRERALLHDVLSADGPPQIHLQHYVITPELNEGWPHTYLEGEHLRRTLAESGKVALSISGHYHPGTELIREGSCVFTTGPAFAEFPHPYRLYELQNNQVTVETFALLARPIEHGRPAVFLDRDGVLNPQPSYRWGPEAMRAIPGAGAALRRLKDKGYALIVVSSQSCVGAGWATPAVVDSVFDKLARELWADGVCWDAFYYSTGAGAHAVHPSFVADPHGKPKPDYLLQAAAQFGLDLGRSYLVGDNLSDLQAAVAAGVKPLLVRTGHGSTTEQHLAHRSDLGRVEVFDSLAAIADRLPAWPG